MVDERELHDIKKVECDKFYELDGKTYESETYTCNLTRSFVDVEGKNQESIEKVTDVDIIELAMPNQKQAEDYGAVVLDAYPDKLGHFVFEPDSGYSKLQCRITERRKHIPGTLRVLIYNYLECENDREEWEEWFEEEI